MKTFEIERVYTNICKCCDRKVIFRDVEVMSVEGCEWDGMCPIEIYYKASDKDNEQMPNGLNLHTAVEEEWYWDSDEEQAALYRSVFERVGGEYAIRCKTKEVA